MFTGSYLKTQFGVMSIRIKSYITPGNVKGVLEQIHIARVLKSEDKTLKPNHYRLKGIGFKSMDIQYIYDNTYKNIKLLSKRETI